MWLHTLTSSSRGQVVIPELPEEYSSMNMLTTMMGRSPIQKTEFGQLLAAREWIGGEDFGQLDWYDWPCFWET